MKIYTMPITQSTSLWTDVRFVRVRQRFSNMFGDGTLLNSEIFDGALKQEICLSTLFITNYVKM